MADKRRTPKDAKPPHEIVPFVPTDLLDPTALVRRLQDERDPISRHLATRFRPETLKLVNDHDTTKPVGKALTIALTEDFKRIAGGPLVYNAKAFRQVTVSEDTQRLLESTPEGDDLVRLNAMLIENAFPSELLRNYTKWPKVPVERVQTGVRIEKRMLKVLKAMAEYRDVSLGELIEDIVMHAFGGVSTFDGKASQERIRSLKGVYGMDYDGHAAYRFVEGQSGS